MHPYLHIAGLDIPTYWLTGLIGILLCILLAYRRNRSFGLPKNDILHTALYILIGGLIGSKLLFLITILPMLLREWQLVASDPQLLELLFRMGWVFYGGLIGGILGGYIYLRQYHLPLAAFSDLAAPLVPLFHACGRVGCFLSGCCYGVPSERWGIAFTESLGAPNGVALLPIQLIEAGLNLLICLLVLRFEQRHHGEGLALAVYLLAYGCCRFVLEFWRGDVARGFLGAFSTSQWVALLMIAGSALWLLHRRRAHA